MCMGDGCRGADNLLLHEGSTWDRMGRDKWDNWFYDMLNW